MTKDSKRIQQIEQWITELFGVPPLNFQPASNDASFRRYFRFEEGAKSYIVMDAPPDKEPLIPFIQIDRALAECGVNVPNIHAEDQQQGFLLLDDFGHKQYLDELNQSTANPLYTAAIDALIPLQRCPTDKYPFPDYSEALLLKEMDLFSNWLLQTHLQITLNPSEKGQLDNIYQQLAQSALEQPRVIVHRDYHSRNLMHTPVNSPGIIDFQDAVIGPVSYDLVSLLRDCYIGWPLSDIHCWVDYYLQLARQNGVVAANISDQQFQRWFDLMGVQRHLKASGIFARLNHRDGKSNYLQDIPRTLNYIVAVAANYPELNFLAQLISNRVLLGLSLNTP